MKKGFFDKMKKFFKVAGVTLAGAFSVLTVIAKIKKKNEKNDSDLQKDVFTGVGTSVNKERRTFYEVYLKRGIDVILSFFGLVLLAPVFLLISVAIVIDDPGPVLFTQKRVGINKTFFKLHKFRSMKMSTPHDTPTHLLENPEQYITRVGKFLRKSSLDELPQIWDIWVGNLSICGPRPALWNQDDLVAERDKYGANDVKPGLTGWAQINGRDELEIDVKARFDGEYVKALKKSSIAGIVMDVKCFLGTIVSVSKADGVVEGGTGEMNRNLSDFIPEQIGFDGPVQVDFDAKKKVLITGANSYIGESFENYAKEHYGENFSIDTVDMIDGSWREKDFSSYDIVFHVAGLAHADVGHVSEEVKAKYYAVNTDLAIETARRSKEAGVKQFVFMSSMIVYGDSAPYGKKKVITATTKPEPANFYGDSKWQADQGVRALNDEKFNVAVLRPPMIYGKGSKGNYPTLAKLAKKLPVFPDVENERSMLHIDNLCEFLCQLMLIGKGGIFFPQNGEYTKTSDMVKEISTVCGKKIVVTKLLNPFVWLASKVPGKVSGLVNKAFGNSCYDQKMSEYEGLDYRTVSLKDSVIRTESFVKSNYVEASSNELFGKKILFIALSGYSKGIERKMREMGAEVDYINDKPNDGVICKTLGRLKLGFYQKVIAKYYKEKLYGFGKKKYDYILVIRGEYTPAETLKLIKQMNPNSKLVLYMWDSLKNNKGIEKKWKYYDEVYSFDRIDVLNYQNEIKFRPLYFYEEYLPKEDSCSNNSYEYAVSFIGTGHEDRVKIVKAVESQCRTMGLDMFSYLYMPHKLVYLLNKFKNPHFKNVRMKDVRFEMIPFEKVYEIYAKSKCVMDIESSTQCGLTMRSIEMLGLKRKFITTNKDIVNYDFYHPNNVMVVDRNNFVIDKDFFDKEYVELDDAIYKKYALSSWILEVLS